MKADLVARVEKLSDIHPYSTQNNFWQVLGKSAAEYFRKEKDKITESTIQDVFEYVESKARNSDIVENDLIQKYPSLVRHAGVRINFYRALLEMPAYNGKR